MDPESRPQTPPESPVKRRSRRPKRTWEAVFLHGYALRGVVLEGCRLARINRWTVYDRRKADPNFARAMDAAYEDALDKVEIAFMKRAVSRKAPDTTAGIVMLKGGRPEKYRERFEHSGRIDTADVTDPEARDRRLTELLAAAMGRKADGQEPARDLEVASVPVGLVGISR